MEKKENLDGRNLGSGPVGRWIIYIDKCTGCGECVDACSLGLLYIVREAMFGVFDKVVVFRNDVRMP